jgi:hypothetical protein
MYVRLREYLQAFHGPPDRGNARFSEVVCGRREHVSLGGSRLRVRGPIVQSLTETSGAGSNIFPLCPTKEGIDRM